MSGREEVPIYISLNPRFYPKKRRRNKISDEEFYSSQT